MNSLFMKTFWLVRSVIETNSKSLRRCRITGFSARDVSSRNQGVPAPPSVLATVVSSPFSSSTGWSVSKKFWPS